jgi:hypothetical protein
MKYRPIVQWRRPWLRNALAGFALLGSSIIGIAVLPDGKKLPVPEAAARDKAEKLIQEVFKEDLASAVGDPVAQRKLGTIFLEQAHETRDDAAARFVLYRQAAELAAQSGDLHMASKCIGEAAREYLVDVADMQLGVLESAAKIATGPDANVKLAEAALTALESALSADDFVAAGRFVAVAEGAARRAKSVPLIQRAELRGKEVRDLTSAYEPVKAAVERLREKPDDPTANLTVGSFSCFVRDNWEKGLPLLAKANDKQLCAAAMLDLARPTAARDQVDAGDAWWDLAAKADEQVQPAMRQRAFYWYELATPHLRGLTKSKVEKRLQTLAREQPNLSVGEVRRWEGLFSSVCGLTFSTDGRRVWASGLFPKEGETADKEPGGAVVEWDLQTGREMRRLTSEALRGKPAFDASGRRALTGAADQTLRLLDLEANQELRRFKPPASIVHIAWSPDGRFAFLGGNARTPAVYLWDLATNREVRRLDNHEINAQRVAFSSDSRTAASAGRFGDLAVHLWEVPTGQELRRFTGHTEAPHGVALSADGKRLLTGAEDKTLRLWDVESGQGLKLLHGHSTPVWCVAFSADGRRGLSGSGYARFIGGRPEYNDGKPVLEDCTVRLWDLESGHQLARFEGHTGYLQAVAFSPDGRFAASASSDRTVRLWRLPR